jgi:predicted TIM-barrel fold metal-dependent hydrolase
MANLFEVLDVDRCFYETRIRKFLPVKMIDIHTHVWLNRFRAGRSNDPLRAVTWPSRVALDNSIEDLIETYRLMFPDKQVSPMIFANPHTRNDDIDGMNEYISQSAKKYHYPSLIFAMPWWSAEELEQKIIAGGFLGAKVYLIFSDPKIAQNDITIFDFLPHHQLEVLNQHGWIVMLHIPRSGRLREPKNLEQMLEIEKRYPNVKLIIAHVGRAYCNEDVGNAFEVLAETKNMMFDFCANTNSWVFEQLIRTVGPKRIMFGSDMPILRMRTRRICENGNYVNLIPKGLYGDVSTDSYMREVEGEEADKLTFFMYEEIDAFRRAAEATKLSEKDIEDIFYGNAKRLIDER